MIHALQRGVVVLCVAALSACGGSDGNYIAGNGNNSGGSSSSTTVKSLEVGASSRQLPSSGTEPVTISAIAKDANNNILKSVAVQFSVNNSGTIEADTSTATTGVKTAQLTPGLDNPENRTLTVTVKAESMMRTLKVDVTGTTLQLDGPSRIVVNAPTTFTAKLKNSAGKGLAYHPVSISSSQGNAITPLSGSAFSTDANGEVSFSVQAALGGTDTLTASALGSSSTKTLDVSGDEFTLTSPKTEVMVNTAETVSLLWKQNGVAQANKTIKLAATRGVLPAQVVTDAQGKASFSITSNSAGGTVITATDATSGLVASLVREFVAITPSYLNVQVEQNVVLPEKSTTVVAVVRDANDNPVKNQVVVFNLSDTVNGSLSSASATTDSLGRATVVYTAGNATSARDGVVIETALQSNPAITDKVMLTVGNRALRIVLGEDENIQESGIYYKKSFGVIVTDSAGNPVVGKRVDFTLTFEGYFKGYMACAKDENGSVIGLRPARQAACQSEDLDRDGWLDVGEDFNGNNLLEPTNSASVPASGVTDSDGKVTVDVTYLQNHAEWDVVRLGASVLVEGTEYAESTAFTLPVLMSDVSSCETAPPNAQSPYGVATECASRY